MNQAKHALKRWLLGGKPERGNPFAAMEADVPYRTEGLKPIFVTGAGRSGTHFTARAFELLDREVKAFHLDDIASPIGDAFEWFAQWYDLPLNHEEFLRSRGFLMEQCQREGKRYLESNPLIALSVRDLVTRFGGDVIIMIRNPVKVVESHYRKGWYEHVPAFTDAPAGYSYGHARDNHNFSRIVPRDRAGFDRWRAMTRLGKITWMWCRVYEALLEQCAQLSPDRVHWREVEKLDLAGFHQLANHLGLQSTVAPADYARLLERKPGRGKSSQAIEWTARATAEYNEQLGELLPRLPASLRAEKWLRK